MARSYRGALWAQLKECYGRLLYTYEVQQKQLGMVQRRQSLVKSVQIILTSISTVGFLGIAITNQTLLGWVAGLSSVVSLALNLYSREANLGDLLARHRKTVDALWSLLQDYRSLLTDCLGDITIEEIARRRDELNELIGEAYREAPRTGALAFKSAQKALRMGEQGFDKDELEELLPAELRNIEM